MKTSRRILLKTICFLFTLGVFPIKYLYKKASPYQENHGPSHNKSANRMRISQHQKDIKNLGVHPDGFSYVYVASGMSPEKNMTRLLASMGGIGKFIGNKDVVILKPNAQWWNQGMTNTDAMKAFIESVLGIPDFEGEIIIAENHHFPEDNSRGWTTTNRNGSFNYNELINYFQSIGFKNVTKCHWHDGGPSYPDMWGGAQNGGIVGGAGEGDGYVWVEDKIYYAPNGRKVMMSYPVFASNFSGITIDFKRGAWKNGQFLDVPVRFINFSALNHHEQAGVTASIKNYLGIVDMTCGFRGKKPRGYSNFHFVGILNCHWRIRNILRWIGIEDPFYNIGGAVGYFMRHIRFADLNIITAEYAGWGSRTDPAKRSQTKAILASTDPVALDYIAAKTILLPATKKNTFNSSLIYQNDPDYADGVFSKLLKSCHSQGIGNLDPRKIKVITA